MAIDILKPGSRRPLDAYCGIDGEPKKIFKMYIGVNGVAQKFYTRKMEFTYTGEYEQMGELDGDWVLWLKSSGTLSLVSVPESGLDIFLVGAGGNGGNASGNKVVNSVDAGDGGAGGQLVTITNKTQLDIPDGDYEIVVAQGEDTKFGTLYTATKAGGYAGGVGTTGYGGYGEPATAGHDGELAFGDGMDMVSQYGTAYSSNKKYGASGGGGGGYTGYQSWDREPKDGGADGAGKGGKPQQDVTYGNGADATHWGAGGGGAGCFHVGGYNYEGNGNPGAGYSGLIIIRNHRA